MSEDISETHATEDTQVSGINNETDERCKVDCSKRKGTQREKMQMKR